MTIEEFRAEQVLWGAVGLLIGVGVSVLMLAANPHRPPVLLASALPSDSSLGGGRSRLFLDSGSVEA